MIAPPNEMLAKSGVRLLLQVLSVKTRSRQAYSILADPLNEDKVVPTVIHLEDEAVDLQVRMAIDVNRERIQLRKHRNERDP